MTWLVTGGAGFIGSAVIRYVISRLSVDVVNLDKLTYAGNLESVSPVSGSQRYYFARVDICDQSALEDVFVRFRPEVVLHLAAESHVDRSIDSPGDFLQTNLVGTACLLQAAL